MTDLRTITGVLFAAICVLSSSHLVGQQAEALDVRLSNTTTKPDLIDIEPTLRTPTMKDAPRNESGLSRLSGQLETILKPIDVPSPHFEYGRLIFEEPLLERFGVLRRNSSQSLVSGAKFFARSALFPALVRRRK